MANASRLFQERIEWSNSVLCLGFDFRPEHVPACFYKYGPDGYLEGERSMISYLHAALFAVQDHVACIKPNIAFFEALGMDGLYALQALNGMARNTEVPVILDAKRGDIGSTNEAYAKAYLNPTGFGGSAPIDHIYCDGLTINPFLGTDSLTPYLAAAEVGEKALFFLVSTSNRDGAMVQQATTKDGKTVKEVIAHWIHERYKTRNFVSKGLSGLGAVVGATDP
ncbi:orotidine-5'-phosphate decarboxylase, partial [bacterium]|nr:orotidine-5'-phosphate decarboxylase [bacterium]